VSWKLVSDRKSGVLPTIKRLCRDNSDFLEDALLIPHSFEVATNLPELGRRSVSIDRVNHMVNSSDSIQ
jgi:hypothetical protein